ncbi:hypothetical protein [Photobacterium sp.]|uniref:hypothetical protein n=1 Tax=Photobacterium sp. TaxID=660 RepID=UPI00299DA47D|nr:hypothetical protein [Photobacterium sp.]MDX1301833.1 hypothetical protein [Photobacterium sp.]
MFKLMGKNSELILSRLKSWRLTDGNGTEGDNLTLTINSDDIDGIPPKGEKYTVYLGEVKRDVFEISQRSIELHPREVKLVLTVSPFSINDVTGYRERKSLSWDNATLSQVVGDCVTPHGFALFVHPELQKIVIQHLDRTEESTPAFLNRLAKQYDAVAKPVESKYIFVPIGKQKSATGTDIEAITLSLPQGNTTENTNFISLSADLDGRSEFNGVRAFYVPTEDGSRKEVKTGSKPFKLLRSYREWQIELGYRSDSVFPVSKHSNKPIYGAKASDWIRAIAKKEWAAHDLRKRARTVWAELGVDYIVGEALLNHARDKLDQAYIHTHMEKQKREALEAYHNWLKNCWCNCFTPVSDHI